MVRLALRLLKRSLRPPDNEFIRFAKKGTLKWRDYKSEFVDPPYWYRWSIQQSPYHPTAQREIRENSSDDKKWYQHNYRNMKITEPDKWLIQVGDVVEVIKGKDAGKQSTVTQIIPERNWVVLSSLNYKYEYEGGVMRRVPVPLDHDDVSLVDPKDGMRTDVEIKADDSGNRVRVSKRTGYIIDDQPEMLWDGTYRVEYPLTDKDTDEHIAKQKSYIPTMKRWEEELNELYNIVDTPTRKTYWY